MEPEPQKSFPSSRALSASGKDAPAPLRYWWRQTALCWTLKIKEECDRSVTKEKKSSPQHGHLMYIPFRLMTTFTAYEHKPCRGNSESCFISTSEWKQRLQSELEFKKLFTSQGQSFVEEEAHHLVSKPSVDAALNVHWMSHRCSLECYVYSVFIKNLFYHTDHGELILTDQKNESDLNETLMIPSDHFGIAGRIVSLTKQVFRYTHQAQPNSQRQLDTFLSGLCCGNGCLAASPEWESHPYWWAGLVRNLQENKDTERWAVNMLF